MAFDVFKLRDRVVGEYKDYVESFVHIYDKEIERFVHAKLDEGELWPDAVLQLNPAYEPGGTLGYRHQEETIRAAARGGPVITSTGTGSGKSLTYLVPIVDHVLKNQPERHSVCVVVVYRMNALINSQLEALESFRKENWPECPVCFARYTGQDRDEARNTIIDDPPHILLTNYVMLEYMLIRPAERTLIGLTTRELAFLVMDEPHAYRGRQGADVAMLLRRVRQRAGRRDLVCIGTSATIVTDGDRTERRARIAEAGRKLFGVEVPPDHVVEETLQRVATVPVLGGRKALAAAVRAEPPRPEREAVRAHPLAAWVEATFGLAVEEGRLVRRTPLAFEEGLEHLGEVTDLDSELCRQRLRTVLKAGNAAAMPTGEPVFALAAPVPRVRRQRLCNALAHQGCVHSRLRVRCTHRGPARTSRRSSIPSRSAVSADRRRIWSRAFASTRRSGWSRGHRCSMPLSVDAGGGAVPSRSIFEAQAAERAGSRRSPQGTIGHTWKWRTSRRPNSGGSTGVGAARPSVRASSWGMSS